jgi:ATP phosphoribosyltransferase regulatory subunit
MSSLQPREARIALAETLAVGGIKPIGFRTIEEITDRYLERAADAFAARLPPQSADLISSFLGLRVPATQAIDTLRGLTRVASVSIDQSIDALRRRFDLLSKSGFDLSRSTFASRFGRNMEYYTGFVFEVRPAPGAETIAGGGRYDNLLTSLGAPKSTPAIGLAIFGERLAGAKQARA